MCTSKWQLFSYFKRFDVFKYAEALFRVNNVQHEKNKRKCQNLQIKNSHINAEFITKQTRYTDNQFSYRNKTHPTKPYLDAHNCDIAIGNVHYHSKRDKPVRIGQPSRAKNQSEFSYRINLECDKSAQKRSPIGIN